MSNPQVPSPPHLYPVSLQIKLYQAFIFSIPILFSIILFLLFYLFYLKRRATPVSSPQPPLPRTSLDAPLASSSVIGLKGNNKQKLPVILFDEDIRTREPMCCVCLGEFELKEELNQIPTCKHVFHIDCIRFWVHSNPTCPLCRCFIGLPTNRAHAPVGPDPIRQGNWDSDPNPQMVYQEQLQEQQTGRLDADVGNDSRIHDQMEGSSSSIRIESTCMENEMGTCSHQDYVVVTIHTHNS
ncbi:probable E3 ubiquitin-protein ligase RHA4A [Rhododendron vialii]|uniref:probable E3 ubiquitin-protein ligase RHA4A n=1 Tax=Rhododendron vialii TaxID=182163 RepID=UPI00265F1DD0|nr:probable E3 ubiquitin-protein ligase RHA4A [Rhododendron vialii]